MGLNVVMIGATGAVGGHVAHTLVRLPEVDGVTLLGRRPLEGIAPEKATQSVVDIFDPTSYTEHLRGHDTAVCTVGVGQPSKVSRDEFVKVDKVAVLEFAEACRDAGVRHFELLGSVGADTKSRVFYLRTKGELEAGLEALGFDRLSLFRPSMILTPTNRYGLSQALALAIWPRIRPMLAGGLRKYRGIEVERLGRAIATNVTTSGAGVEVLHWDEIDALADGSARA